jgi:VanZ family protein
MAVIFFFSAQPDLNSGLGLFDTIGRKLIHFAQYALLALVWWRALRTRFEDRRAALAAFVVTALYAATDEYHQSFVEGRNGSPLDWLIDCAGAAASSLWLARRPARLGVRS